MTTLVLSSREVAILASVLRATLEELEGEFDTRVGARPEEAEALLDRLTSCDPAQGLTMRVDRSLLRLAVGVLIEVLYGFRPPVGVVVGSSAELDALEGRLRTLVAEADDDPPDPPDQFLEHLRELRDPRSVEEDVRPTASDSFALHRAGENLADYDLDFERDLGMWRQFVHEAEGYRATVYDYTNDLCVRDHLEEWVRTADPEERGGRRSAVDAADRVFVAATVEDVAGELDHYFRIDRHAGWWWGRIPAHGPLADYLRERAAERPPRRRRSILLILFRVFRQLLREARARNG